MSRRSLLCPLLLLASGCAWITDAEWNARIAQLDSGGPGDSDTQETAEPDTEDTQEDTDHTGDTHDTHDSDETGDSDDTHDTHETDDSDTDIEPEGYLGEVPLTDASMIFYGESDNDSAGTSVALSTDLNGDGVADLLVGARGAGSFAGRAYLFSGPLGDVGGAVLSLADADTRLSGASGERAGTVVTPVGDLDGDTYQDFAIGAPENDDLADNSGKIYLYWSPVSSGSFSLSDSPGSLVGSDPGESAGSCVTPLGDLNGDGRDDLGVGVPESSTGGAFHVFFGDLVHGRQGLSTADLSVTTSAADDSLGAAAAGAWDFNGDGAMDFFVGLNDNDDGGLLSGEVLLFFGPFTSGGALDVTAADRLFIGEEASDLAGSSLAFVGDANTDGYDDLLVGAPGNTDRGRETGRAYLLQGSRSTVAAAGLAAAEHRFLGESVSSLAGASVARVGDLDGEGHPDLAIGASRYDATVSDAGRNYLFYSPLSPGTHDLGDADATFTGTNYADYVGTSASGGLDISGDSRDDLILGVPGDSETSVHGGAVYLFPGF